MRYASGCERQATATRRCRTDIRIASAFTSTTPTATIGSSSSTFRTTRRNGTITRCRTNDSGGSDVEFPNDADGDALRRLAAAGNDMSRPMAVDFTVAVPSLSAGHAVANAAQGMGYRTSVEVDEDEQTCTCYCTKHMVASYDAVVLAQQELNRLSGPHGGQCDGWGSFGNASESSDSDSQR